MSNYIVGIVTVLYIISAVGYCMDNKYGLGLAFFAYALANVGLILAAKGL